MSTEEALKAANNRYARRRHKLKAYGLWQPFVDAEPARQHLRALKEYGVSAQRISEVSGLHPAVIGGILYDFGDHKRRERIRTETAAAIFAVQPRFEYIHDRHVIDGTATRRRLQALAAIGFPFRRLGEHLPLHPVQVGHTARSEKVQAGTHRAVAAAYKKLAHQNPTEHGIRPGTALKIRRYAQAQGWAPPIAWDDDTIDDPNAHPDWTGHCGSDRGYWMHQRQQLPMCARCEKAHEAWLDEHADLTVQELNRERFRARAAASSREADLAHDARELMRVSGLSVEQAAERLQVTRPHLHQALKRHPAAVEPVEVAVETTEAVAA
ncbi:hypothetical protein [Streptomyces mirabilis]|uniref:hypothetical protein n=1 Tax=Streptomyces mirabilis TaxID=68239 RepID=UPI00367FB877